MLPAPHRLTRGDDLRRVSRRGRRGACATLVVHVVPGPPGRPGEAGGPGGSGRSSGARHGAAPARVGFVVSRAVGNAVLRHRVQRRLRHLCHERLGQLPAGSDLVVRALEPAGRASYQELGTDLDRCLQQALSGPRTVS